jgi:hypothetical protein
MSHAAAAPAPATPAPVAPKPAAPAAPAKDAHGGHGDRHSGKSLAVGSAAAGVMELLIFHPIDTTAKVIF